MREFEHRSERQTKRKFRYGRLFLLLLIIALIITTFSTFQYWSGYHATAEDTAGQIDFTGDEPNGDFENVLLLGSDARGEEPSRTDTIMIASWNKRTSEVKVISFMRDIYAAIPGYEDYKLNTAYYLGGVELLKETLSDMFGIPIHHYALIDFQSFEQLVDVAAPKGVEIDVEKEMSEEIGVTLMPGVQRLNGQELLGYARFRADEEGDFGRVRRQQQVIGALKEEFIGPLAIAGYPKLAGAVQGAVQTDMAASDQLSKAIKFALFGGGEVERLTIPAEGTYSTGSYSHAGSVLELDLEANRQVIQTFLKE